MAYEKVLAQHSALKGTLSDGKAAGQDYDAQIKVANEKLSKIKTEVDKHQAVLNKAYDKQNSTEKKKLEEEKELLFQERKKKDEEVQSVYNKFLEEKKVWEENSKLWDAFQREEKKKRAEAYAAEKKERAEAYAAELAAKTPYEEEMLLCDYLVNYLTTTFLGSTLSDGESKEAGAPIASQIDGEFAGMVMTTKKGKDDPYLAGTGKKVPKKKGSKVCSTKNSLHGCFGSDCAAL